MCYGCGNGERAELKTASSNEKLNELSMSNGNVNIRSRLANHSDIYMNMHNDKNKSIALPH